jgi:hypothetical protein
MVTGVRQPSCLDRGRGRRDARGLRLGPGLAIRCHEFLNADVMLRAHVIGLIGF